MKIVVRCALAALALALFLSSPVVATEPAAQENRTQPNAPAAPPAATDAQKGPGCMPGGECCGSATCAQAAVQEKAAADGATGGCPCMKRRQAADKPS